MSDPRFQDPLIDPRRPSVRDPHAQRFRPAGVSRLRAHQLRFVLDWRRPSGTPHPVRDLAALRFEPQHLATRILVLGRIFNIAFGLDAYHVVLQQQWDELLVVRLQVSTSGGDCRGHAAAKRRRAGQCEAQSAIIGRAWNLFDAAGRMGSGSNREPSASRAGAPSGQGVFARTLWP
jgi:hypothetical protein